MHLNWLCHEYKDLPLDDLYELLALRIRVFVVEQDCPYEEADGKDKKSIHLYALKDGRCIACLRLVKPGISYAEWSIGRVATDSSVRRTGIGKELMQRGMSFLRDKYNDPPVRISAQSYLLAFYTELGFVQVGEEYLEDDIPHIEMLCHNNSET